METLLSGFQLPFQRRLTKMYTDTKSSYDFVKESTQPVEDPEIQLLHRKLRIQKDRLVSWGLAWSDPSKQSPDIDESLNRAGLSDLAGSIMTTIKEILPEAEYYWQSYKRASEERAQTSDKVGDRKVSYIPWDRAKFEDLVKDLTISIDTLYDLSKTRQSSRKGVIPLKGEASPMLTPANMEAGRRFESSRMRTPQQIDPSILINRKSFESDQGIDADFEDRQIMYTQCPISSSTSWKADNPPPLAPVLLEYAPYDPIYASTGITPSMTKFEKLFTHLESNFQVQQEKGLLNLAGYFEDSEHARFGLVYEIPKSILSVDDDMSPGSITFSSITLSAVLFSPSYKPPLESRFHLSCALANSVLEIHQKSVVHGNLSAESVIFFKSSRSRGSGVLADDDLCSPFLVSFDLFSEERPSVLPKGDSVLRYKHSLDPRVNSQSPLQHDSKALELYQLALMLLEIGMWAPLTNLFPERPTILDAPSAIFTALAARCGSLFMKAVLRFWHAPHDEVFSRSKSEPLIQEGYWQAARALETCALIDQDLDDTNSNSANRSIGTHRVLPNTQVETPQIMNIHDMKGEQDASISILKSPPEPTMREKSISQPKPASPPVFKEPVYPDMAATYIPQSDLDYPLSLEKPSLPKPRVRLYSSVKIAQEHLDHWHTTLMPHINHVLRGFYRKHPESVEISLESIGESAKKTKPTILVMCTSVNKVRSLLKKSLTYDSSTYGLKVHRGRVLRSRKQRPKDLHRSIANEAFYVPANPFHQERPLNGASIGAYVDDQNLPAVSLGGLIMIDEKPYGMTVHHMLDAQESEDDEDTPENFDSESLSFRPIEIQRQPTTYSASGDDNSDDDDRDDDDEEEEFSAEFSDYDSDQKISEYDSDCAPESDDEDDDDDDNDDDDDTEASATAAPGLSEAGDTAGVDPRQHGRGVRRHAVTQPAIDDVDADFYPCAATRDEEHLLSFALGSVWASSGLKRRRSARDGLVHEVDWALVAIDAARLAAPRAVVQAGARLCRALAAPTAYPARVEPLGAIGGRAVHCMARTSGLQRGRIAARLASVKMPGRRTPSQSWVVESRGGLIGVSGDSGAWVVADEGGGVCGVILARSEGRGVAYICPMEVVVEDVAERLGVERGRVRLPAVVGSGESAAGGVRGEAEEETKGGAMDGSGVGLHGGDSEDDVVVVVVDDDDDDDDDEQEEEEASNMAWSHRRSDGNRAIVDSPSRSGTIVGADEARKAVGVSRSSFTPPSESSYDMNNDRAGQTGDDGAAAGFSYPTVLAGGVQTRHASSPEASQPVEGPAMTSSPHRIRSPQRSVFGVDYSAFVEHDPSGGGVGVELVPGMDAMRIGEGLKLQS